MKPAAFVLAVLIVSLVAFGYPWIAVGIVAGGAGAFLCAFVGYASSERGLTQAHERVLPVATPTMTVVTDEGATTFTVPSDWHPPAEYMH